jgi:predicted DNA-binding transcriptional regulator AlpA
MTEPARRRAGCTPDGTIPDALRNFDSLPDSALVRISVVEGLTGRSMPSVYRDIKAGRLPRPRKFGGSTVWNVGELRKALCLPVEETSGKPERV